jgi:uncharacterized protein
MRYNAFGKTGKDISLLGFGCMRLPMAEAGGKQVVEEDKVSEMLARAYELGVNYFDTAYFYNGGLSEIAVGKAIRPFRSKVMLSTKSPGNLVKKPGDFRRILEEQLRKLDTGWIDFYHFHGIGWDSFHQADKAGQWLLEAIRAKEEGIVRHISFSFHDKPENLKRLVDLGVFSSVLCQYSAIDRSNEEAMAYAKAKGLGVVIMGPLGGGRISGLPKEVSESLGIDVKSSAELGLRFVMSNRNVDCVLSGMETMKMLEENAGVASNSDALGMTEYAAIADLMRENEKLAQLYCTGCGYCLPCPAEVAIPQVFRLMNYHKVYGITEYARKGYADIGVSPWSPGKRADACTECGLCESKCPQNIQIRSQLKESHQALGL